MAQVSVSCFHARTLPEPSLGRLKAVFRFPEDRLGFFFRSEIGLEIAPDFAPPDTMRFEFGDCALDPAAHLLMRDGAPVHVEPQVFALIHGLARRAPALFTYDDMLAEIWGGRIVSDATLSARIAAARAALGDDGRRQAVIRTIQKRGVQMALPVKQISPDPAGMPQPAPTLSRSSDIRLAPSADGTAIAWTAEGEGPPIVRAGHWLTHLAQDTQSQLWGPWIERLGSGRRLIRFDPRGSGLSGPECGELTTARGVEDMEAVFDAAGIERAAIFAASQSAAITFSFAAAHPDRVSRIVTWGAFVQGSRVRDGTQGATMTDAIATMIREGWGQPNSSYAQMLAALFMPQADRAMTDHLLDLQMASAGAERALEIRDVCSRYDVVDVLPKVTAPILAAHGTGDTTHPFAQSRLIASMAPDARLLGIETNNHVLSPDEPGFQVLMEAIDAFLRE